MLNFGSSNLLTATHHINMRERERGEEKQTECEKAKMERSTISPTKQTKMLLLPLSFHCIDIFGGIAFKKNKSIFFFHSNVLFFKKLLKNK